MTHTLTPEALEHRLTVETQLAKKGKLDQLICWWSIPIFYQIFGLIFGYLTQIMRPPIPGPALARDGIIAFTVGNATHMQIGTALLAIFLGFASMGTGVIVVQMKRMSGAGPVLAYAYLACGAAAALPGCYFCGLLFSVAAFRPDRDPQIIALLYEMGFVGFIGCLGCFRYPVLGLCRRNFSRQTRNISQVARLHNHLEPGHRIGCRPGLDIQKRPLRMEWVDQFLLRSGYFRCVDSLPHRLSQEGDKKPTARGGGACVYERPTSENCG